MNIPADFNYKIYKELNNDLKDLSEEELKKHYFSHGINENRPYKYILPDDFNYKIYKELNSDLNNFSEEELKKHYFFYGINESRLYKYILPDDFNYKIYRDLNNDLKDFSEEELKKHYFFHGKYESRLYKNNLKNIYNSNRLIDILKDNYNNLNNQLNNLFTEYNCNNVNDRIRISDLNKNINNYLIENNSILNIEFDEFKNLIFQKEYLINNLKDNNYNNFNIYHNKEANLKNHILIINNDSIEFDEIILNVNYKIISDTIEYKYKLPFNNFKDKINDIEYIIFENSHNLINNNKFLLEINNYENLSVFLSKRTFLLRICIPSFDILNERLTKYINQNEKYNNVISTTIGTRVLLLAFFNILTPLALYVRYTAPFPILVFDEDLLRKLPVLLIRNPWQKAYDRYAKKYKDYKDMKVTDIKWLVMLKGIVIFFEESRSIQWFRRYHYYYHRHYHRHNYYYYRYHHCYYYHQGNYYAQNYDDGAYGYYSSGKC
jgi:hypothetical protein